MKTQISILALIGATLVAGSVLAQTAPRPRGAPPAAAAAPRAAPAPAPATTPTPTPEEGADPAAIKGTTAVVGLFRYELTVTPDSPDDHAGQARAPTQAPGASPRGSGSTAGETRAGDPPPPPSC